MDARAMSFDRVASLYDAARPTYPEALFDDLLMLAEVPSAGRVLEVGAGSGQATEPLARRGLEVVALEPGPNLAALARRRLAPFDRVSVATERFEEWRAEVGAFDLVTSATAFHWIDPAVGYGKAKACLRPSGALGLFWNDPVAGLSSHAFNAAVQPAYGRWAPALAEAFQFPAADEADGYGDALIGSGEFERPTIRRYPSRQTYTAEGYVNLLRTFSDHIALAPEANEGLLGAIREVIDREFAGAIDIDRVAVLYVAKPI
jgi:SAM-dependent methyltransferase